MSQTANRNSIFGWVKNLKKNTLLSDSLVDPNDELSTTDSKSPSRSSFQLAPSFHHGLPGLPFPASPTKEKNIPQVHSPPPSWLPGSAGASDFLRPLLSHKSRSTNNVHQTRSNSLSHSVSQQDQNSASLRQHRDSFLQSNPLIDENSKYFGIPLADAISQAAAKISILGSHPLDADDSVLHYGRIPIVVAKCGVYLKNNGLNVEGIFRVGGSSKRIKELQIIFNTPPDFGKKLSWDGYTVHDAASLLRRYLNALPEPLIPLDLYEDFRDPLRSRQRIIKYLKYKADNPHRSALPRLKPMDKSADSKTPPTEAKITNAETQEPELPSERARSATLNTPTSLPTASLPRATAAKISEKPKSYKNLKRDVHGAIDDYKQLLDDLPDLSKQLLFYILDLLAMVQSASSENLMSSRNLAAIFQPSILSHPSHDMDPDEYALSQSVVEFLIQYSSRLLPNNEPRAESLSRPMADVSKTSEAERSSNSVRRPHSKSLSTPNHDLDLIGYRSQGKPPKMILSDAEHDFVSASSDDEGHNWPAETKRKESSAGDPTELPVPIVVLNTTQD